MKNKKLLLVLIAIMMLSFSACGKKEEAEEPKENTEVAEQKENEETTENDEEAEEQLQVVPDFELKLLDGTTANLYDYKDKIIFLNFWATWCGPCKYEMPDIQKLSEEFGDRVQFLAINAGEDEETVKRFMEENEFDFTVALDEKNETPFMVQGLPTTIILNSNYEMVTSVVGLPQRVEPYEYYSSIFESMLENE
ncbi:MAG: TlpA family protein disulfide reductase [Tissierellia bacterium]|nr:TlpA family protein disulfide reductase [Tissierellia bacterium]